MKPLLILGAGTYALETLDIAEAAGGFSPLGFVVNVGTPQAGLQCAGLPVYWIDDVPFGPGDCYLTTGIVSTKRRCIIEAMQGRGYRFTSVVHPSAVVSRRSSLGEGCVVSPGVIVASNTIIDPNVILNRGCLIGHDNHIESFCTIGPGANLAGGTHLGMGAYIGVGAVVRDHLTIGQEAVVGAGAVVVKPVPPGVLVGGVPAKIMKTGIKGL